MMDKNETNPKKQIDHFYNNNSIERSTRTAHPCHCNITSLFRRAITVNQSERLTRGIYDRADSTG